MGRPPRPIAEHLTYLVLNRGNDRRVVFHDDSDVRAFLTALGRTQLRSPFQLFGYCLMSNHFHLLLRPDPGSSISRIMQSLTIAHTRGHHRRHGSVGHVGQGRFKAPVVQETSYLWTVLADIEANPVRAGMVADAADWPWSSDRAHAVGNDDPLLSPIPDWSAMGGDEAARRAWWRQRRSAVLTEEHLAQIRQSLVAGRPFGDPQWVEARARELHPQPTKRRPPGRPRKIGKPWISSSRHHPSHIVRTYSHSWFS